MRTLRGPLLAAAATLAVLPAAGVAQHGYHCGAPPPLVVDSVPLWNGVAHTVSFPINTSSRRAQDYFDQGVALIYGFNHGEAVVSFRKAASLQPLCASCWWGIAMALGPNINEQINQDRWVMAAQAADSAFRFDDRSDPKRTALIEAARLRYLPLPTFPLTPDRFTDLRKVMDQRYSDAMGAVWRKYNDDLHVGTMYVESLLDLHPWDLWLNNGDPKWPTTDLALREVEGILAKQADHVGAAHLKIHILEGSTRPDLASYQASILEGLMPGSGHITHMPSHIGHRTGLYAEGVGHNLRATALDSAFLAFRGWQWRYPMYYAHDNDFLWVSATFVGMRNDAVRSADALKGIVGDSLMACYPSAQHFLTAPALVRARFGDWNGTLNQQGPDPQYAYARGMWFTARGWAQLRLGNPSAANASRDSAEGYAKRLAGKSISNNPADSLVLIAASTLYGEILAAQGNRDEAIRVLNYAAGMQDRLRYDEPPPFFYPVRHSLGAVLIEKGDRASADSAIRVYRTDLGPPGQPFGVKSNPMNPWAYVGMAKAVEKLGGDPTMWYDRARRAWQGGALPPSSRY